LFKVGCKGYFVVFKTLCQQVVKLGFVNSNLALLQAFNFGGININAHYLIAFVGKANTRYRAYVTCSDDGNFHIK
jgi:hypothetical protein